ncbi:hypothetical protein ABES38_08685 [Bacillus gobiensis]|uniref:hypothetical protein n=1 Tax=Bacillus gobiensis TaxID=1441095 RepID=UPI003D1B8E46
MKRSFFLWGNEKRGLKGKTEDFLFNYSWEGKPLDQVIDDMALSKLEQYVLDAAIKEFEKNNAKYKRNRPKNGYELDQLITQKLEEFEEDDWNEEDVEFIERSE